MFSFVLNDLIEGAYFIPSRVYSVRWLHETQMIFGNKLFSFLVQQDGRTLVWASDSLEKILPRVSGARSFNDLYTIVQVTRLINSPIDGQRSATIDEQLECQKGYRQQF